MRAVAEAEWRERLRAGRVDWTAEEAAGRRLAPVGSAAQAAPAGGGGNGDGGLPVDGGVLSAGCGKSTTRPDRKTQQTISIGRDDPLLLAQCPERRDTNTPLPLVFALHGYDMNNVALVDLYDFTSQSGNKAITVLPQGEGPAPGNTSHWGDSVLKSTWTANTANYDFMQMLKADIEAKYCVDTSRVYFTGFSMGGMFTNSMACDHNDWFRGFAPGRRGRTRLVRARRCQARDHHPPGNRRHHRQTRSRRGNARLLDHAKRLQHHHQLDLHRLPELRRLQRAGPLLHRQLDPHGLVDRQGQHLEVLRQPQVRSEPTARL